MLLHHWMYWPICPVQFLSLPSFMAAHPMRVGGPHSWVGLCNSLRVSVCACTRSETCEWNQDAVWQDSPIRAVLQPPSLPAHPAWPAASQQGRQPNQS